MSEIPKGKVELNDPTWRANRAVEEAARGKDRLLLEAGRLKARIATLEREIQKERARGAVVIKVLRELSMGALDVSQADTMIGRALAIQPSPAAQALLELAEASGEYRRSPTLKNGRRFNVAEERWREVSR